MAIELKSKAARDEIRDQVVDNWRKMKDERAELEREWERCLMAYLCQFDKAWAEMAKKANRSCRYMALSWDAVETLTPQIFDAIFGVPDWLKIAPLRLGYNEQDDQFAEMQKHLCLYQHQQTGFNPTAKLAIKSLLMLGNCPWSMNWHEKKAVNYEAYTDAMLEWMDESRMHWQEVQAVQEDWLRTKIQMEFHGGQAPPMPEFKEPPRPPINSDVIFAGPKLQIGSIFNYVEEQFPNDRDEAIRIMRTFRTKAFLQRFSKPDSTGYRRYGNLAGVENSMSEDRSTDITAEQLFNQAIGLQMPHGKDKVELKAQYGTFELNGASGEKGVYRNYIAVVANDNTLIQCEPAPLWSGKPTVNNARLITIDGAVYGYGIIAKSLHEQDSANAIHNQTIDATNCIIQPEQEIIEDNLVDGVAGLKPSGPGARHYVTEKGTFNPITKNFQGIPIGREAVEGSIARHERFTGAINTSGQSGETATRTARNSGIIATKLGGHVSAVEDELITPAINMQIEMNAQYLDGEQVFAITQDGRAKEIKVSPEAIRRGAVAHAVGSKHLAEKQEKIQNLMTATQLATELKANAQGAPIPVRIEKLYKILFTEILGESGEVVMSDEEYQAEMQAFQQQIQQQQMMQMQLAAQQQGGAAGGQGSGTGPAQAGA